METLRIIGLCVLASIVYGIVHDQVTARLCLEYFTIGHPQIVASDSPTTLGIVWGIVATWWVGLMLGVPLALAARLGARRKVTARELLRPTAVLLAVMAVIALAAGLVGHMLAARGDIRLVGQLAARVPADRHVTFLSAGSAHLASYASGFIGGLVLIVIVIVWRLRARSADTPAAGASTPPVT